MVFLFLLGLVLGSFLNVCIYRIPRNESIIFPASHCPACGRQLAPLDLVPILSFVFLRGRCRSCGQPISWRYPVVELLSGLAFAATNYYFPALSSPLEFVFFAVFIMLLIIVAFIDLEHQLIPDAVVVSGLIFGLAYNLLAGLGALVGAILGAGLGFALFWLIAKLGKFFFKKEAMGEGDFFLAAFIGAYLGWQWLLLAVFLAYLLAGLAAAVLLARRQVKADSYLPFGPALAAGAVATLFFGRQIMAFYFKFLLSA